MPAHPVMSIGVAGELGVDGQPHRAAVRAGHPDGVLHPLGAARNGGHVGVVLFGARISSRMAPSWISPRIPRVFTPESTCFSPPTSAARFCISPRPLYTCSSWSFTALKLSVTRFCNASCSCSSTVWRISSSFWAFWACRAVMLSARVAAHLFQLAGVGCFQPLQALLHGLLLRGLPGIQGAAHTCTAVCSVSLMPRMAS